MNETLGSVNETENTNYDNSRDIGAKTLNTIPDVKNSTSELPDSRLDPFWDKHPKLLEEAQKLGAPLTVKEFKEGGYGFEIDASGEHHVLAPTQQYSDWLKSDGATPFIGVKQESIKDQEIKAQKEKIQTYLENRKERLGLNNPEKTKSKPWDDLITDKEAINFIYDTLYPNGIEHADREEIIASVIGNLERSFPAERKILSKINKGMTMAYEDAFLGDNTSLHYNVAEEANKIYDADYFSSTYYGGWKEQGSKIVGKVAELQLEENMPQILEKTNENLQKNKETAVYLALKNRSFFPRTLKENPDSINAVFENIGIDKDSDLVTIGALVGYGSRRKSIKNLEPEAKAFDLENKIADLFENNIESEYHIFRRHGNNLEIFADRYGRKPNDYTSQFDENWYSIDPEISKKVVDEIEAAEHSLADELSKDPEFEKTVKTRYEEVLENRKHNIVTEISFANTGDRDFDFNQYLDTKTLNLNADEYFNTVTDYIRDAKKTKSLGNFIDVDNIYDILNISSMEVGDEYENTIKAELLRRLSQGSVTERYRYSQGEYYSTEIFRTEGFKDNQERLGIDFKDPEIMKLAFDGFINTIRMKNGEKSEQADWYYDNIFANDPGGFLEKVKALREQSKDRGTKAKITRFFKNNPQAFEDKIRVELDRRFYEEINSEKRAVKTSVLRNAKRGDINKIVNDYKSKLIDRVREKGADEIATFAGERRTYGEQEEGSKKRQRETPFDFGLEKGNALIKYGNFIETTFPDCNINWFTDTFPKRGENSEIFDDQDSYLGFSFEYQGKLCVIAESLNNEAAMYLWRGEIGEDLNDDFKQMFDMARFDAKRSDDPRIISVGHLDKDHFDDSLDTTYQKAFMFFNSGNKDEVLYKNYGGQEGWSEHRDEVLGAWPLNVEQDYGNYPKDLDKYHAWQERQSGIKARLNSAMKQGGRDAVKRELEKIAEEDYLAMSQE